jgi:hypothetical protein
LHSVYDKPFTQSTKYENGKTIIDIHFRSSVSYASTNDAITNALCMEIRDALFLDFFGKDAEKYKAGATHFDIIKYGVGQKLVRHSDFLNTNPDRQYTIVIGLKKAQLGGDTVFTEVNKRMTLEVGDVLFFENLNADGSPNMLSLHAGEEIMRGEKMVAVMFITRPSDSV